VLVSVIISPVPYWLYKSVSSLSIFLSSLGVADISSSYPQVLCCGAIQFWSSTSVCSGRSEGGNPLLTYLTNVLQLSAGETGARPGATSQLLVLCQVCQHWCLFLVILVTIGHQPILLVLEIF